MISSLSGKVAELGGSFAVIDVGGVGYKAFMSQDVLRRLKIGADTLLHTYLAVREDAMDLYGFLDKKDKNAFELLITISGIGPKSALNILSLVSADTLYGAIRTGSTAHLVKVSGIGKKTAEKIVLELKDKLGSIGGESVGEAMSEEMTSDLEAIEALKALGYEADESREALKKIGQEVSGVSAKVKAALRVLGK